MKEAAIFSLLFTLLVVATISVVGTKHIRIKSVTSKPDTIRIVDTVFKCKPDSKSVPKYTKYKVSDVVCVWGKWSGTITSIDWSENDNTIVVYTVSMLKDSEFEDGEFYETEINIGKCY